MARYEHTVGGDLFTINTGHSTVYIGSNHQMWANIHSHNGDGIQKISVNGDIYERRKNEGEKDFIHRVRNS